MKRLRFAILLIAALTSSCAARGKDDGSQWAVVAVSDAFMREEARYGSECVSQCSMGTLVQVLERSGYWARVRTPEPYEGWVNELALAPVRALDAAGQKASGLYGATLAPMSRQEAEAYLAEPKLICLARDARVCDTPGGEPLATLLMGNIVRTVGDGYRDGWRKVILPDGKEGWAPGRDLVPMQDWERAEAEEDAATKIEDIIALAKSFVGCPYLWGGMSPGHFDCSGLVNFCFRMNGIQLPRDAGQQVKCGEEVPVGEMLPGDLVFFGNSSVAHVAICIGGRRIIHASQLVRINSLDPDAPDYYGRNILHVRRIVGHLSEGGLPAK